MSKKDIKWTEDFGKSIVSSVSITIGDEEAQNLKYCEKCKRLHEWQYGRQLHTCEWIKLYKDLTKS
jgi:hypothetical protein